MQFSGFFLVNLFKFLEDHMGFSLLGNFMDEVVEHLALIIIAE
jgi:hypothetical protein